VSIKDDSYSFYSSFFCILLEVEGYFTRSTARAGTIVRENIEQPRFETTPNSVIFTPCLMKLKIVVVSSGTDDPIATIIPVISLLKLYLLEILTREGIIKRSAIIAKLRRMYIAKMSSRIKMPL